MERGNADDTVSTHSGTTAIVSDNGEEGTRTRTVPS